MNMKTYKLLIIYPGMNSIRVTVEAEGMDVMYGGYHFFNRNPKSYISIYPINLTIIESIS